MAISEIQAGSRCTVPVTNTGSYSDTSPAFASSTMKGVTDNKGWSNAGGDFQFLFKGTGEVTETSSLYTHTYKHKVLQNESSQETTYAPVYCTCGLQLLKCKPKLVQGGAVYLH
jgi:hypothetical protein